MRHPNRKSTILSTLLALSASFVLAGCGVPLTVPATTATTTTTTTTALAGDLRLDPIGTQTMKVGNIVLSAHSSSPATIQYAVVSGPATIEGSVVTFSSPGAIVVSATQQASEGYAGASVTTSFAVSLTPTVLQIANVGDHVWNAGTFQVNATSASDGPIAYSVQSGPALIAGNTVQLTGAGSVTLTASQRPTSVYAGSTAQVTFDSTPAPASPILQAVWTGDGIMQLSAQSASPALMSYTVVSGSGSIFGTVLNVNGPGAIVVQGNQPASANYLATSGNLTINVSAPRLEIQPASLVFAATQVDASSDLQVLTVTNTGDLPAPIAKVTTSSSFLLADHCGNRLSAHATCSLQVGFLPESVGLLTGSLGVSSNSSVLVPLSGTGLADRVPTFSAASVTSIQAGVPTALHITGNNLDLVNSVFDGANTYPVTHNSSTDLSVTLTPPAYSAGPYIINGTYTGQPTNKLSINVITPPVSYDAAVRFAQQATMAVTPAVISDIQAQGFAKWIDTQMSTPIFPYESQPGMEYGDYMRNTQNPTYALRMRVTLALKFIYTFGASDQCFISQCGHYWEARLEKDAFGNHRDLLTDITLSPLMGNFLDNARNFVNYPYIGTHRPNQNYARELLQLMTIGPNKLNHDGTLFLDGSGNSVPNYDENNVNDMAGALTGLYMTGLGQYAKVTDGDPLTPMSAWQDAHMPLAKTPLPGLNLPANQPAMTDLTTVLDAIFAHPNVGPFLARRFIQHLVTSNPSPEYVSRIASVFDDNGKGVRGDLGAVFKAILLDEEARRGDDPATAVTTDGHMMEPLLYVTNTMAAMGGVFTDDRAYTITGPLGQDLFMSANVFGPIAPDFRVPTGEFAPETQLVNGSTYTVKIGFIKAMVTSGLGGFAQNLPGSPFWNEPSSTALLDQMRHFLFHGQTPTAVDSAMQAYVADHAQANPNDLLGPLLVIALTSSGYQVMR